jgi:hypothetical protein
MAILKIRVDEAVLASLLERAESERRPPDMQAEVLLRQSLGLPFPVPVEEESGAVSAATTQ